ncbi:hypothetical protein VKT23_018599 [Stygiomarasmius scandens]|uniref:Uncharacterized protein n=1 Tax=Marasmiellus scandens TaxID=2682957 RepID=A0ABR1INL5_9AGAR
MNAETDQKHEACEQDALLQIFTRYEGLDIDHIYAHFSHYLMAPWDFEEALTESSFIDDMDNAEEHLEKQEVMSISAAVTILALF